jgi:molybdopterin/thiamine biosynthesis adenylyltransferase
MTRGTRVIVWTEELERLAAGSATSHEAVGVSLDGEDIVHLHLSAPGFRPSGRALRAIVRLAERRPNEAELERWLRQPSEPAVADLLVVAWRQGGGFSGAASMRAGGEYLPAELSAVGLTGELASRARGIIETRALAGRKVAVAGLGSGGSMVALALAQAGVGRMVLIDRDRLEVSNIARHICGLADLGRYKTRAVADALRQRNPFLELTLHAIDVVEQPALAREAIAGADLLIGATDGDRSRFVLNQTAVELGIPAIFGRALARAAGGDVLRVRPHAGPCLACIFTEKYLANRPREISGMREAQEALPDYVSDADRHAVIQVGLGSDIAPIANMIAKLALVELARGTGGGLESLDADLTADLYTWANRREGPYAAFSPLGSFVDGFTILRWYGARAERRSNCPACTPVVAEGAGFFAS